MKKELTRRNLLGRAGLALGGAVAIGSLACGSDDSDPQPQPQPQEGPQVADFPYKKHLAADFRLDVAAVKEAAYHAYYNGGCCHAAYSALLGDLQRAGAPFTLLPLGFGKFGAGGIASYGSICGAALGGALIINMVVEDPAAPAPAARNPLIVELMRWYERYAFPEFVPNAIDAAEQGKTTIAFDDTNPTLKVVPGSHLCHASVTTWCAANGVAATSPDKLARCARLSADVAGKTAELLNAYLAGETFTATPLDDASKGCGGCHSKDSAAVGPSVASGMSCNSCHPGHTTYPHP
ncbi:C-GCAxxG-C-C family protein [Anaeromyxobacter sp. Fw109-5]|uniref:C-GCAxxG-C-C family protein n=1 Tax=Anaeromyxobacter sp. (strain Fw109-5) TaxID=404589 RepID=UPI0000ED73DB|nr:C-GCAxxG-C-C family protein [Anaeromyxobacter sp. Fw109-5]ABS26684.1 conserved hypothetical protein [Anaeromyxobacter sp. Fw109-5]